MLDLLKEALNKIRGDRATELQQYKMQCKGNRELIAKRHAILKLELPFKIDTLSVMQARAASQNELDITKETLLGTGGTYLNQYCEKEGAIVVKKSRKLSKKALLVIKEWLAEAEPATAQGRQTVWRLLRENSSINALFITPTNPQGKFDAVTAEDLLYILSRQRVEQVIYGIPDIGDAAKKVYLSHANSLLQFLSKGIPVNPVITGRRSRLSIEGVASLFEYLENRALQSSVIRAFLDLVLLRALFYAPIPRNEFFGLSVPNMHAQICVDAQSYPVPQSFVCLCRALPTHNGKLFGKDFDEKQLNKKLHRLGEYAGLTEITTPSSFRLFARSAWMELLIDEGTKAHLPRR